MHLVRAMLALPEVLHSSRPLRHQKNEMARLARDGVTPAAFQPLTSVLPHSQFYSDAVGDYSCIRVM